MLTGHVAVAIGAHGIRQAVPLWLLIVASQLPDWADATLCTVGVRSSLPGGYSHSFVAVGLLAVAAALAFFATWRDGRGSFVVGAVVMSHAVGDYFTGIKPTWPGGPMIGLELYTRPELDFILEAAALAAGWLVYQRSLPEPKRFSRNAIFLLAVLLIIQAAADIVLSLSPGLKKC